MVMLSPLEVWEGILVEGVLCQLPWFRHVRRAGNSIKKPQSWWVVT